MEPVLGIGIYAIIAILGLFALFGVVFFFWMLIHTLTNQNLTGGVRAAWVLSFFFIPFAIYIYGIWVSGSRPAKYFSVANLVILILIFAGGLTVGLMGYSKMQNSEDFSQVIQVLKESKSQAIPKDQGMELKRILQMRKQGSMPFQPADLEGFQVEIPDQEWSALRAALVEMELQAKSGWTEEEKQIATELIHMHNELVQDDVLSKTDQQLWLGQYQKRAQLQPGFSEAIQ